MHELYDRMRGGTAPMLDLQERSLVERIVSRDGLKLAFIVWVSVRVVLSLWGFVVTQISPANTYTNVLEHYPDLQLPEGNIQGYTVGLWNVYDTTIYTKIAETGYESDPGFLTAFFPGYPLLIKLVSVLVFGNTLLAAILVSNIAALIFFWYLYRLVEADYGHITARRTVIFSALFPTSFFLSWGTRKRPCWPSPSPRFITGGSRNGGWQGF